MPVDGDAAGGMRRFLVLKLPRTGSSMFGTVLNAHPSIECVNEYLNRHRDERRRGKVRALRSFYYRDRVEPGRAEIMVGQTMNPFRYRLGASDIASVFGPSGLGPTGRRLTARFRELPIRVVVLLRENLLKQGISLYIARKRGFESSRELIDDPSVLKSQVIDADKLAGLVTRLRSNSERLQRLAARLRAEAMHLTFEQLQDDPKGTFDSVFGFLGVPPVESGFDYTAGFTKVLSEDLRDVLANFAELERHPLLAGYL